MKLKILLFLVFFTQQSFADDSVVNSVKFAQEIIKNSPKGTIDTSCVECSAVTEQKKDMFCEDLYEAACFDKDGKQNQEDVYRTKRLELKEIVKDARDATAKALGFKNTSEYLQADLKKEGLELDKEPEAAHWNYLMDEDIDDNLENFNKLEFKIANSCRKDYENIEKENENTQAELLKPLIQKYGDEKNKMQAKNIPEFIKNEITNKCSNLKGMSALYPVENNAEVYELCKQFIKIKNEAINLYRLEGDKDYDAKALAFIEKYNTPDLIYNSDKEDRNALPFLQKQARGKCYELTIIMNAVAKNRVNDLMSQFSRSKPTVEYLIEKHYTPERKEKANAFLKDSITSIKKLLPAIVSDQKKIKKIVTGYSKLELNWLKKPQSKEYETGKYFNLPVIKEVDDDIYPNVTFMDSHLGDFTAINASYKADIVSNGNVYSDEKINMLPAYLAILEEKPYSFLSTVAHEAGHKIGPVLSKVNGHDLGQEWKDLIQCYEKKESIKLQPNQKDETISDYISSIVLSDIIGKLPQSERRKALKEAMYDFCLYDDNDNQKMNSLCKGNHPINPLRISGIYGANPVLREVVGCTEPSSKFQQCGLKKAKNK